MSIRCKPCGAPYHEATGHVLQAEPLVVLCGACARSFFVWYKGSVVGRRSTKRGDFYGAAARARPTDLHDGDELWYDASGELVPVMCLRHRPPKSFPSES